MIEYWGHWGRVIAIIRSSVKAGKVGLAQPRFKISWFCNDWEDVGPQGNHTIYYWNFQQRLCEDFWCTSTLWSPKVEPHTHTAVPLFAPVLVTTSHWQWDPCTMVGFLPSLWESKLMGRLTDASWWLSGKSFHQLWWTLVCVLCHAAQEGRS